MKDYSSLLEALTAATAVEFQPASQHKLRRLGELGLPANVLRFYEKHAPVATIEHGIRLWSIDDIVYENTELMPGCCTSKYGYFVFASTLSGDAYCFNTNTCGSDGNPRIVLISHEIVFEDTTPEQIAAATEPVAQNLAAFLKRLIEASLPT